MIIPKFFLDQDGEFLIIIIRLPYVKISNSQFYIESDTFKFYLSPYYLNLTFKQPLQECEEPAFLSYDHNKCIKNMEKITYFLDELTCKLKKQNKNEIFEDLNLLTNLLQKSNKKEKSLKKIKKSPLIEVLSESNQEESKDEESNEKNNVEYPNDEYKYGFNDQFFDFFKDLQVKRFFFICIKH